MIITYSVVNSVIISNELTHIVNFSTWFADSDFHNSAFLDLFISPLFVLQWLSLGKF